MLVSFTQTYGSGRDELLDIYFRDKRLIDLKNHFDQNIYSFHNCQKSTVDKFRRMSEGVIKGTHILEFNNSENWGREQWFEDGYTETIRGLMEHLRNIGCTHFFFSQDDTFSSADNQDIDWAELIDYIKKYDKEFMLNLFHTHISLDPDDFNPQIDELKTFKVYKSTTNDFSNTVCYWPMDDGPFICTMDILEEIYDDEYLKSPLICIAEKHLRDKYTEREINRFVLDKRGFQNFNILGPNSRMGYVWRNILKKRGLL